MPAGETLNNSSSQAGLAIRDGLLGQQNRSNSGAIARICNAADRPNPPMAVARGIVQRFPCSLCSGEGEAVVWRGACLRVIRAAEEAQCGFPAFYRVVWNAHVAEWSDLSYADRLHCMDAVTLVEQTLRQVLQPTKINLAALGNVVPHLHWHVIARYAWDSHFPAPVWAAALRPRDELREQRLLPALPRAEQAMYERLQHWESSQGFGQGALL